MQRGIGDVLLAWENEALLAIKELGPGKVAVVVPSLSILAEPSVAVVDKVVLRRGTREVATEYLNYLYSKEGQEIVAKNYYRPRDPEVAAKYAAQYPQLNLVTIKEFGGRPKAQSPHFENKGMFEDRGAVINVGVQPAPRSPRIPPHEGAPARTAGRA